MSKKNKKIIKLNKKKQKINPKKNFKKQKLY